MGIQKGFLMNLLLLEKRTLPANVKKTARKVAAAREAQASSLMNDTGLLILRVTTGGLLAAHGSQKLLGWFNGPGFKGFAGFMESMGLKPGTTWATAGAAGEFGGGVLNTLGLLHPLGPMGMIGAMIMATAKAHWGKPIWSSAGGPELPVTDIASALSITLTGPGRFSLDRLFGIRLPRALVIAAAVLEIIVLALGIRSRPAPAPTSAGKDTTTAVAR